MTDTLKIKEKMNIEKIDINPELRIESEKIGENETAYWFKGSREFNLAGAVNFVIEELGIQCRELTPTRGPCKNLQFLIVSGELT